jgi:ABC-type transport system involved in multi-copper enzyme maturation permease subunit
MNILRIAATAVREAARRRIVWVALLAGAAFLSMYGFGLHFALRDIGRGVRRTEVPGVLLLFGLFAAHNLIIMIAVLTSVDTLSEEIASGTIHAIAARPLRRWEIVLGKWLGFVVMLTMFVLFMAGGTVAVEYRIARFFPAHFVSGLALIWLLGVLLITVTFLWGTSFSTLTNGVLTFGLHGVAFIGASVEQFGALAHRPSAVNLGIIASLLMPSEVLWRRASYLMQPAELANGPGDMALASVATVSVPSSLMVWYAAVFTLLALLLTLYRFSHRDL